MQLELLLKKVLYLVVVEHFLLLQKLLIKIHPGDDQKAGVDIVRRALEAPIRTIANNAGVEGSVVVGRLKTEKSPSLGYDAQNDKYVDMFIAGIIDPTKVVRTAYKMLVL